MYGNDTIITQLNAKELILAKINATPELVDIYTYLTAIGIPFKQIADLMVTDTLQMITKLGESNVFDKSSNSYKVKDWLEFYVGKSLPKGIQRDTIITYMTLNGQIGKTTMKTELLIQNLHDLNIVNATLEKLYKAISTYSTLSDDEFNALLDMYEEAVDIGIIKDNERNIVINPYNVLELRNAIKFLEMVKQMLEFKNNSSEEEIKKIKNIVKTLPSVEEMSILGRSLGVNQGLPTSLFDLRNRIKSFENYIPNFNFDRFVTDSVYRDNIISTYDEKTFNLPGVISSVPHFWEMIQTMYYAKEMLSLFSIKNRTALSLAQSIEDANSTDKIQFHLSEREFKSIQNYINDVLIATFLRESKFEVLISPEVKLIHSITGSKNYSLETRRLQLDSAINVAAFKNWMDTYVIPMIIKEYKGNPFVDELKPLANATIKGKRTQEYTGWKFPFNLTDADKSVTTQQLYGKILKGFNEIANQGAGIFGQTIGDLFYVYNMIVNKDSFGQTSFTKIFEDLVQNNPKSLVNQYNEFVSQLDDNNESQLTVTVSEASRRIKKDNPDSRIKASVNVDLGPDFVLDLQDFYGLPNKIVITPIQTNESKVITPYYKYSYDNQSLVVEMVKQLNKRLTDSEIHLITDDDLEEFKGIPQYDDIIQSKGFILNGEVYINLSRANGATLLHEFAHLVLAAMKSNPATKERYYKLITSVKQIPEFDQLANAYPNHIGSDLYEEVFATVLEAYLDNKEYYPSDYSDENDTSPVFYAVNLNEDGAVLQAISYLLSLEQGIKDLKDIIDKPIGEILDKFGFDLLSSDIFISKTIVINNQKQNTVKQELFKDKKLTMKCDE